MCRPIFELSVIINLNLVLIELCLKVKGDNFSLEDLKI